MGLKGDIEALAGARRALKNYVPHDINSLYFHTLFEFVVRKTHKIWAHSEFFIHFFKNLEGTKKLARVIQSGVNMIRSKAIETGRHIIFFMDQG